MRKITETDISILRRIEDEQPIPPNYLIRLELLGLARDEASGPRLTIEGRRALRDFKPPPRFAEPESEPESRGRRDGKKDRSLPF